MVMMMMIYCTYICKWINKQVYAIITLNNNSKAEYIRIYAHVSLIIKHTHTQKKTKQYHDD